jgi:hypothetical protein
MSSWASCYYRLPFCCQSECCRPATPPPLVTHVSISQHQTHSKAVEYSQSKSSIPSIKSLVPLSVDTNTPPKAVIPLSVDVNAQAKVVIVAKETLKEMENPEVFEPRVIPTPKAKAGPSSRAVLHVKMASSQFVPPTPTHHQQASTDIVSLNKMLRDGPTTE